MTPTELDAWRARMAAKATASRHFLAAEAADRVGRFAPTPSAAAAARTGPPFEVKCTVCEKVRTVVKRRAPGPCRSCAAKEIHARGAGVRA